VEGMTTRPEVHRCGATMAADICLNAPAGLGNTAEPLLAVHANDTAIADVIFRL
jgi:hypothetical protein